MCWISSGVARPYALCLCLGQSAVCVGEYLYVFGVIGRGGWGVGGVGRWVSLCDMIHEVVTSLMISQKRKEITM